MHENLSIEEQLKRSEREKEILRHAIDQASILAVTDLAGTITLVNDKFCEISKFSREELLGQNHRILNSGFHPREFFTELWKTISSGQVWKGEIRNRAKDGSHYWVFTTIIPFLNEQGRPFQYFAIRTDITEQKAIQEKAAEQQILLLHSEKMASLGEIAAGIGHELGNPLSTVLGRMEFLEMQIQAGKGTPEEILKTITAVKTVADRMAQIIRAMLALARDGTQDPFQNVSIAQLVHGVLGFTLESFKKHGIELRMKELDDRIQIYCQETQISQVLVNLINNAKDAVKRLEERWIQIEIIEKGPFVEIAVSDSGKGIPREIREKIMLPFFTTKDVGEGSGLGLSISRAIVEKHQGTIRVDSDAPNTCFIVTLQKKGLDSHE